MYVVVCQPTVESVSPGHKTQKQSLVRSLLSMAPCTLTLICVYTELMGQIRESCTVIAAASAVTLWLTQRSSLALSLKGRPFAFQSQCGNNLAV